MGEKFKGKTAWVSGGTKGIGEAAVRMFAEEGACVGFTARGVKDGEAFEQKLRAAGYNVRFFRCDVSVEEDIRLSIEGTAEAFGGLSILVNNAGTIEVRPLHEYDTASWHHLMDTNVTSIFHAFKYAFPYLRKHEMSYVVNVGSISSYVGQLETPVYTTSKGAVMQLSRSIGLDYAKYGVRSNCVCPGITDTPLLHLHLDTTPDPEGHLRERLRRVPLGRVLTPEDVAKSILYFSCEDSAGITATNLIVDGGYLAAAEWDTEAQTIRR